MGPFSIETNTTGKYHEVYLYLRGILIYKAWFIEGVKVRSLVFYFGEGRTYLLNRKQGRFF